jgi:hypothetical protein
VYEAGDSYYFTVGNRVAAAPAAVWYPAGVTPDVAPFALVKSGCTGGGAGALLGGIEPGIG